jgi:hypothetical protein
MPTQLAGHGYSKDTDTVCRAPRSFSKLCVKGCSAEGTEGLAEEIAGRHVRSFGAL